MKKPFLFIFLVVFCFPYGASAEIIVLKSGKIFEGKIISHGKHKFRIESENGPVNIAYNIVDLIESSGEAYEHLDVIRKEVAAKKTRKDSAMVEHKAKPQIRNYTFGRGKTARKETHSKYFLGKKSNTKVELYMTSWCPYCVKMEKFLKANGISYQKFNIEKDLRANKRYRSYGGEGVPLIKVGKKIIKGYKPQDILQAHNK